METWYKVKWTELFFFDCRVQQPKRNCKIAQVLLLESLRGIYTSQNYFLNLPFLFWPFFLPHSNCSHTFQNFLHQVSSTSPIAHSPIASSFLLPPSPVQHPKPKGEVYQAEKEGRRSRRKAKIGNSHTSVYIVCPSLIILVAERCSLFYNISTSESRSLLPQGQREFLSLEENEGVLCCQVK